MRLPQNLIESSFFALSSIDELATALGNSPAANEIDRIKVLSSAALPPITSVDALSAMIGINPGIVWSFINRPRKHYRIYEIPKGDGVRIIASPRVGLKVIQSWIGYHLSRAVSLPPHVFGFVPGRSHIDAAFVHKGAEWAYSVDIANFFGTTPSSTVVAGLLTLGYDAPAAEIIFRLSSIDGFLAQGSPISPTLSNLAFLQIDARLAELAARLEGRLTRYADDIVFSGRGELPVGLSDSVKALFVDSPWSLSAKKERIEPFKGRIKVHGLIVNSEKLRLTKGYRNKIRAYRHVLAKGGEIKGENSLLGHVRYSDHVSKRLELLESSPPEYGDYKYPDFPEIAQAPARKNSQNPSTLRRLFRRLTDFSR